MTSEEDDIPDDILTDEEIAKLPTEREREIAKGRQVWMTEYGRKDADRVLSEQFNPEHNPDDYRDGNEGARPSPDNKAYRSRMQAQVRDK